MSQSHDNQISLQSPYRRVEENGQSQAKKNNNGIKNHAIDKNPRPRWVENTNTSK